MPHRQSLRVRFDRGGFTLVELLTTITIIGVLASMTLLVVRGAQRDSLDAKTRVTIGKIHEVLAARWEEYFTQPLPIKLPPAAFERNGAGVRALSSREMSRVRLIAIRDLMRLELPDCPGDVKFFATTPASTVAPLLVPKMIGARSYEVGNSGTPLALGRVPAPSPFLAIRKALQRATASNPSNPWDATNANEELLYLIVANSFVNGSSALELFAANELGDTDGDGLREFVDAWGRPIAWIRWPAGAYNLVAGDGINDNYPVATSDPFGMESEDPFDPLSSDLGIDMAGFEPGPGLFPLVISAGFDGVHGVRFRWDGVPIEFSSSDVTWPRSGMSLPAGYPNPLPYPDPYHPRGATLDQKLGFTLDPGAASDNITNYDEYGASL